MVPSLHKADLLVHVASMRALYAAIDYGADCVVISHADLYTPEGLTREDIDLAVGYAHLNDRSLIVDIHGVVREADWPRLLEDLAYLEEIGVNAISTSDMGVVRVVREYFPRLKWHAGERLHIHNAEGANWAKRNGFERITIARNLTLDEVKHIRRSVDIKLEAVIHIPTEDDLGVRALFACLGDCSESTEPEFRSSGQQGAEAAGKLNHIGVDTLRIDGRLTDPLQTACIVDLYRRLLNGEDIDVPEYDRRLQLIHGINAAEAPLNELEGVPLGVVERVQAPARPSGSRRVTFKAKAGFERNDSIVVRAAGNGTPAGDVMFQADRINLHGKRVFKVSAGDEISLPVPEQIDEGHELLLVSSNAIRRMYPVSAPSRPDRARIPVHIDIILKIDPGGQRLNELGMPGLIEICGRVFNLEVRREYPCKLLFADRQPLDEDRLQTFFERLGSTRFELRNFSAVIPAGVFIPAAEVNESRRRFLEELDKAVLGMRERNRKVAADVVLSEPENPVKLDALPPTRFSAVVDKVEYMQSLPLEHLDEVTLDIADGSKESVLDTWEAHSEKLRVAVPPVVTLRTQPMVSDKLRALFECGARRFMVSDLGGFEFVARAAGIDVRRRVDTAQILRRSRTLLPRAGVAIFEPQVPEFERHGIDVCTDWTCFAFSREAAKCWLDQGVSRLALMMEEDMGNLTDILRQYANLSEVVVYHDAPLMMGESRAAQSPDATPVANRPVTSPDGTRLIELDNRYKTVVVRDTPVSWSERIPELEQIGAHRFRLDFVHRSYTPERIRQVCERVMNRKPVAGI
jgi:U32 family peptidase